MPLIKNNSADRMMKHALVLDLGDLNRQADRILDEARAEAGRIVAEAQEEARRLVEGADERGYEQGLDRGLGEGRRRGEEEGRQTTLDEYRDKLKALADSWTAALQRWEEDREAMLRAAREDVLAFAFAMGRKITGRLVELDATLVQDQLAETLSLLSGPSAVTVVLNPRDRPLAEEVLPNLLAQLARCEHAEIAEDDSITSGGCVIRTADGVIDATIEKQIDRIAEALLPDRSRRQDPGPGAETDS
jgi:flagellar assembly protein FliH